MKLRKFQAATMREAIAEVKAALGPDAMIVATRDIRRANGSGVEVTAAIDDEEKPAPAPAPVALPPPPPPPAPAPSPAFSLSELDVERIMAPLRSELRSLRSQLRPTGESVENTQLKKELAAMRETLEALKNLVPGARKVTSKDALVERARGTKLAAPSLRRVIALVGPTGVGKTTTIAKIAAREALIALRSVAIVSLDTYRVGGEEQIRIFAELIGVPLVVVRRIEELPATIDRLSGYDRVLIDTAGRSPRDEAAIATLTQALASIPDLEIHLALAAGSDAGLMNAWVARYGAPNIDRLIFTKVDEAAELCELVETPARTGKPVSWLTTGQRVPEDIEDATAERLLTLATEGFSSAEEEAA